MFPITKNLSIGESSREDIINELGLPDIKHNDDENTQTKLGDSARYGSKSGMGDTATFTYHIHEDEFGIDFYLVKDTLRKISWRKNPY